MENQEFYCKQITTLYHQILDLKETFDFSMDHTLEWNNTLKIMGQYAREIAEKTWPKNTVIILPEDDYENKNNYPYTNLDYEPLNYNLTVLKILKYYDPQKTTINKYTGEKHQVQFWEYFMYILRNDVFRYCTELKIEEANKSRVFKISRQKQRTINKMIHLLKIKNKENPEIKLNLYSKEARKIFLQEIPFKNEKELDKLLELNRASYEYNTKFKDSIIKNTSDKKNDIINANQFSKDEMIKIIQIFIGIMEKCFTLKMNQKKQKPEAQKNKILFAQEIITCYYIKRLESLFPDYDPFEILDLLMNRNFTSNTIMREFLKREMEIINILKSNNPQRNDIIKKLMKTSPASLESISIKNGKEKNYGTRRITDFRKFMQAHYVSMLKQTEQEVVQIIQNMI